MFYFRSSFMSERVLSYATLQYRAPIVYITYNREADLGFVEVRELIRVAEELSGNAPYLVLSDVRDGVNLTPQGKKIAQDPDSAPLHKGTAVLLRSALMAAAANFFDMRKKPPYYFKAFTDEQQAVGWLMSLPLERSSS